MKSFDELDAELSALREESRVFLEKVRAHQEDVTGSLAQLMDQLHEQIKTGRKAVLELLAKPSG